MSHAKSNILFRPGIVEILEKNAEATGNGSIFRACLAVLRSCKDPILEEEMTNLVIRSWHPAAIDILELICAEHGPKAKGELEQAFVALQNAIGLAQEEQARSTIDEREGLWLRLDRLVGR